MKKQKKSREIVIDGDFILGILIIGILVAYYLKFVSIDWYSLGYWVLHTVAVIYVIQIIIKVIKFIYNKFKKKNKGSDV